MEQYRKFDFYFSCNNETTPAPKVVIHRTIDPISNDLPSLDPSQPGSSLRRRKVNWGPQIPTNNTNAAPAVANLSVNQPEATVDDDGFESLNGKSSGGEDSSNAGGSSETYYNKKLPYTNTWINGIEKDTRSDSDTDTLRNTPTSTSHEQCGGILPQATSNLPPGKPRRHLSSESGIELQRHDRSKSPLLLLDDSATNCGSVDADGESKGSGFDENLESSGDTDEENDFDLHQTESSHHLHHHAHHHSHHHHLHHQHLSEGTICDCDLHFASTDSEYSILTLTNFFALYVAILCSSCVIIRGLYSFYSFIKTSLFVLPENQIPFNNIYYNRFNLLFEAFVLCWRYL